MRPEFSRCVPSAPHSFDCLQNVTFHVECGCWDYAATKLCGGGGIDQIKGFPQHAFTVTGLLCRVTKVSGIVEHSHRIDSPLPACLDDQADLGCRLWINPHGHATPPILLRDDPKAAALMRGNCCIRHRCHILHISHGSGRVSEATSSSWRRDRSRTSLPLPYDPELSPA